MTFQKLVYGVGLNDVPGGSGAHGRDPFYVAWSGMLKRCYSARYVARYPAYQGCSVVDAWLTFSSFKAWMGTQIWTDMVLDKDLLLPGNKVYGPDSCLFIPAWVNNFVSNLVPKRRTLPMGVAVNKQRFVARYMQKDMPVTIGHFDSAEQAHAAYSRYRLSEMRLRIARYCEASDAQEVVCRALHSLYEAEATRVDGLACQALPEERNRCVTSGKLTLQQVREIREAHIAGRDSRKGLAERYGISRRSIDDLISGVTWKTA